MREAFAFNPIGVVRSPFKEKFGIPRQPGLIAGAESVIELGADPDFATAVRGMETFSHLWVIWVFHEHGARKWKPSIRPPRLGGAKKVGVLSSRSPHRPNPIGLSAVKLVRIEYPKGKPVRLVVSGLDCLDGTPVLDLKPYLPYADRIEGANAGWADEEIKRVPVKFLAAALKSIKEKQAGRPENLRELITGILELDPRPAFQKRKLPVADPAAQGTRYGVLVLDWDVKWEIRDGQVVVLDVV